MTFERTTDYALIREILTHPRLWDAMSDDGTPPAADWEANRHPGIWYVLVRDLGFTVGLFVFEPCGAALYRAHTCLLPIAWGRTAIAAGSGALAWMFEHSPARRIYGETPKYNRLAIRLAEKCGMRRFGVHPRAFLKRGEMHDLVLTGIDRP